MKKVGQLVVAAALALLVPVAVSMPVSAIECEIGYTGVESDNICVSETTYECTIDNKTVTVIDSSTEQDAATGSADVEGNGEGGDVITGTAENSSGATYTFRITNGDSGRVCVANKVTPPVTPENPNVPEQPEQPEQPTPGRGEASAPVQPSRQVTPTALPVTSGDTAPAIFLIGGAALTAALVFAYRRLLL